MSSEEQVAAQREEIRQRWEQAAAGWGRRADAIRTFGMPVSAWMVEQLALQPGQRVLELAAGPGDTGFLAAELVLPAGTLISSDAAEGMLDIARRRAQEQRIENVEFRQLEIDWIDLDTASVDAVICRWGLMFSVDPAAAAQEMRRVLRPQGRVALAVWDLPEHNPWATLPTLAAVELGYVEPPDPGAPGMFTLAAPGRLAEMLGEAGFLEVHAMSIEFARQEAGFDDYLTGTLDLSSPFAELRARLSDDEWDRLRERLSELTAPFADDGGLRFPARSIVAAATA